MRGADEVNPAALQLLDINVIGAGAGGTDHTQPLDAIEKCFIHLVVRMPEVNIVAPELLQQLILRRLGQVVDCSDLA